MGERHSRLAEKSISVGQDGVGPSASFLPCPPCPIVGAHGIGPCASFLSGKRSTDELRTQLRRVPELNRRIEVLQTPALPLRQRATSSYCTKIAFCRFFS